MFNARISPDWLLHLSQFSDDSIVVADTIGVHHANGRFRRIPMYENGNARNTAHRIE